MCFLFVFFSEPSVICYDCPWTNANRVCESTLYYPFTYNSQWYGFILSAVWFIRLLCKTDKNQCKKNKWPQKSLCVSKAIIEGNLDMTLSQQQNAVFLHASINFVFNITLNEKEERKIVNLILTRKTLLKVKTI